MPPCEWGNDIQGYVYSYQTLRKGNIYRGKKFCVKTNKITSAIYAEREGEKEREREALLVTIMETLPQPSAELLYLSQMLLFK